VGKFEDFFTKLFELPIRNNLLATKEVELLPTVTLTSNQLALLCAFYL
jgi:hypothetical protein